MSTPGVPPWGCPWHGLVREGELELPNGQVMQFPQPFTGETTLIRVPDLAPPINTEDDAQAGRQWWGEAILAGGRLHGRTVGLPAWIYIDQHAAPWRVRCESLVDGAITLLIDRFGVLGGVSEQYQLEVQFDRPVGGSGALSFSHAQKEGRKAILRCGGGWIEVSISGSGEALEATAVVIKDREEAEGETIETNLQPDVLYIEARSEIINGAPEWEIESWWDLDAPASSGGAVGENGDRLVESISVGRTVAMYYDPAGGVVTITSDIGVRYAGSYTAQAEQEGRGYYRRYLDGSEETSFATVTYQRTAVEYKEAFIRLYRNGVLVVDDSVWWEGASSYTRVIPYYMSYFGTAYGEESTTYEGTSDYSSGWSDGFESPAFNRYGQQLQVEGWRLADGQVVAMDMNLRLLSNVVQAPVRAWGGMTYLFQALSPNGLSAHSISSNGSIYGSWCPVTQALSIDTVPICYT